MMVAGAVGLTGCGSDTTTFTATVCPAIRVWADDVAAAANSFTDDSNAITAAKDRRARYLEAIVESLDRTRRLQATVEGAVPPPGTDGELIQIEVDRLVLDAEADYADELSDARQLPLSTFATVENHAGTLFTSTEKSFGIVYHGLTDLANAHHQDDLKTCGRTGGQGVSLDD
jgi:hypothetical protein